MKLNVRYDDEFEEVILTTQDVDDLWVTLSLDEEELPQKEKESKLQEEFDRRFNRPEYNNFHKFERYRGFSKARPEEGEEEDETFNSDEPLITEVRNPELYSKYENEHDYQKQHEEVCAKVREILSKKPHWAEAIIAIRIDGMSVDDYAKSIGIKDASAVSHWLTRAEKKLREKYPNASEKLRLYGFQVEAGKKEGPNYD